MLISEVKIGQKVRSKDTGAEGYIVYIDFGTEWVTIELCNNNGGWTKSGKMSLDGYKSIASDRYWNIRIESLELISDTKEVEYITKTEQLYHGLEIEYDMDDGSIGTGFISIGGNNESVLEIGDKGDLGYYFAICTNKGRSSGNGDDNDADVHNDFKQPFTNGLARVGSFIGSNNYSLLYKNLRVKQSSNKDTEETEECQHASHFISLPYGGGGEHSDTCASWDTRIRVEGCTGDYSTDVDTGVHQRIESLDGRWSIGDSLINNSDNKINKNMSNNKITNFIKQSLLSSEEKLMRKHNLKNSDGEYTEEALSVLAIKYAKDNEEYLISLAKDLEKEEKDNK